MTSLKQRDEVSTVCSNLTKDVLGKLLRKCNQLLLTYYSFKKIILLIYFTYSSV